MIQILTWREWGAKQAAAREAGEPWYMMNDIAFACLQEAQGPLSYKKLCEIMSAKTGVAMSDMDDNASVVLDSLINHKQVVMVTGGYQINPNMYSFDNPLLDGNGYKP